MNIRRANSGIRMASHRLVLREFVVTDEDAVHAFAADPLVTRFTDWDPTASKTPEHSLAEATAWATNPQRAEFRQYLLGANRHGLVIREIWLLRLRALLVARARGDETAYRDNRDRYRAMATSLDYEGHMKWAEAMPCGRTGKLTPSQNRRHTRVSILRFGIAVMR